MLQTLEFSTTIEAPKEKVWNALWEDQNYRNWTKVFTEGSHFETDWKEGSRILFLDAKGEGMFSKIDKMVLNKLMAFEHLGMFKDGKEQPLDEQTKAWAGAKEIYSLTENNGKTVLEVKLDTVAGFDGYFNESFPKALKKVKELSEN
ncbi:SRPBCC domain-containing protein [Mangrovimonas sp. TPBH4]|uniref:SRPBCC domain-containing protein n=1 Tax=Mangrovimonas sp. TPBH4 TaxID=1645914 RepID=UPI0006B58D22|nr:SRPBCC domain-containing protein [Mangrovimonas sp. TPBH4]